MRIDGRLSRETCKRRPSRLFDHRGGGNGGPSGAVSTSLLSCTGGTAVSGDGTAVATAHDVSLAERLDPRIQVEGGRIVTDDARG